MRKVTKLILTLCVLSTLIIGCQNINQQSEDTSVISLEMPKALFQTESASGQVVTYTVNGTIINADSKAVIETVTQTVISSNSATLTFAPIAVQTPIILSIEVYAGNELYMSGTSARHIVVEGAQSLDITLIKSNGETTTGTGTITGTAKYLNSSDQSGIVIFIQKEESVSSTDEIISTNKTALNFVSSRSASRLASTSASNITVVSALACVKADSDGNYSFKNLSAGSYSVYATSLNSTKAAYNTVTVSDDTATTVNLDLTATGSISGTVQLDGNTTGNGGISVYISGTSYIAITDDTGAFTISNVPASTAAYTLCALYGTTVRTLTTATVAEGGTANISTITFTTTEAKHYLYKTTKDDTGNTTKTVTTSYVQATKNGLKFVLSDSDLPAKTAIVELFVTNANTNSTVKYTINHVSEITGDAVFTFRLTNKNIQYTNVFVGLCESTWANYTTIGLNENITSIGGDGEITATATSLVYTQTSNTVAINPPVFNYEKFSGQISSYPSATSDFQVVADSKYSTISIPSSNSINLFTDFSSYDISVFSGQTATFYANYKVILMEDLLYTASVNVNANDDGKSNNAEPSCSYNIFTQTLTDQTINTFTPTLTAWANGGIVTKTVDTTTEIGETYTATDVALTTTSTLGDLYTAISTLNRTYNFIYKTSTTTDTNISDTPYVKDNDSKVWLLSDLANSTEVIGCRSFTLYPVWTLKPSADWAGSFPLTSYDNINYNKIDASSMITSSGTLTIDSENSVPTSSANNCNLSSSTSISGTTYTSTCIITNTNSPTVSFYSYAPCTVTGIKFVKADPVSLSLTGNGGTITSTNGTTISDGTAMTDSGLTTVNTIADLANYCSSTLQMNYTFAYTADTSNTYNVADFIISKVIDTSTTVLGTSTTLSGDTTALGTTTYTVYPRWQMTISTTDWSGSYTVGDSLTANTILLNYAAYKNLLSSDSATLTITTSGTPVVTNCLKNNTIDPTISDTTYTYTITKDMINGILISGSSDSTATISAISVK